MRELTEQAQRIIQEFEERIRSVSPEERAVVLKRMTSHINALNEEIEHFVQVLNDAPKPGDSKKDLPDQGFKDYV